MADDTAAEGEHLEARLRNFLRDGRLIRLPAKFTRRKEILRYLAMRDFRPRTGQYWLIGAWKVPAQ